MVLAAIQLRPGLTAVGTLVPLMTGLGSIELSLVTTIPLLMFGAVGPVSARMARRWGTARMLTLSLVAVCAGSLLRWTGTVSALMLGTAVFGAGMVVGNVLLPGLVKERFPASVGQMTSLYVGSMSMAGAFAAAVAIPLADSGLGWAGSLGVWGLPALFAALVWLTQWRSLPAGSSEPATLLPRRRARRDNLLRSGQAWLITGYFAYTILTFYVCTAWMPAILIDRGLSPQAAGWALAMALAAGAAMSIALPLLTARAVSLRAVGGGLLATQALCGLGVLLGNGPVAAAAGVALLGAVGGAFALSFVLFGIRASDHEVATGLSGMAQSIGYPLGALGPFAFGIVHELTHSWEAPMAGLVLALGAGVLLGLAVGDTRRPLVTMH
ncbi:MFS transporter [Catellatospora sp. IY07-71]|uniref:MFS transporter n=1 Tax=Catellatospora sp. IY07-71 TaxID=2728827 RepID=UPI001BB4225C|nr:MFS transporter [Catellatospora sp. IY07-71]